VKGKKKLRKKITMVKKKVSSCSTLSGGTIKGSSLKQPASWNTKGRFAESREESGVLGEVPASCSGGREKVQSKKPALDDPTERG